MLNIHIPNTFIPERSYIIKTILHDFLGLNINLRIEKRNDILIKVIGDYAGKTLRIADILFQTSISKWLTIDSLPRQPLKKWELPAILKNISVVDYVLPVIYGDESQNEFIIDNEQELYIGIDIFGSAFFMLTRYEEYVKPDRDQYDCFPVKTSLSYQEGFLERPIINEYIEILWWCLKYLWPGIKRKKRDFRTFVTHDVDVPFAQAFNGIKKLIRNCGGDILIRKSAITACRRLVSWISIKTGDYRKDLNYSFDRIMDIGERNGIKSAFYFKTACTNKIYDDTYSISHKYIRQLLRDIHSRGHEIGLHPSYESYNNLEQTRIEFNKLLQICEEEGIQQNLWGGRQHYLRWQGPNTWRNWADVGLNYDSTLGYNEQIGFRCGVCYEYPVFDLERHIELRLIERPLIVMEGSIFDQQNMGLSYEKADKTIERIKNCCRKYNGEFIILWHNNTFTELKRWIFYEHVLKI